MKGININNEIQSVPTIPTSMTSEINSVSENNSSSPQVGIPQLSDERKKEIKRKLLERQRQARKENSFDISSSSSNSTSVASSSINDTNEVNNSNNKNSEKEEEEVPNEERIRKAVTFLSSPKIQSYPDDRKHSFLMTKGCTKKEIEIAEEEVKKSNNNNGIVNNTIQSSSQNNVITPSNQIVIPQQQPIRYYPPNAQQLLIPKIPLTRKQKVQRGIIIFLFSIASMKAISVLVKKSIIVPLKSLYQYYYKYLNKRQSLLTNYLHQVLAYCNLFKIDDSKKLDSEKIQIINTKKESNEKEIPNDVQQDIEKDNDKENKEDEEIPKNNGERKIIKLKFSRKNSIEKVENETEIKDTSSETSLSSATNTLSSSVQNYIQQTSNLQIECKKKAEIMLYDLDKATDLMSGNVGLSVKIVSEVSQIVSREVYYNSSLPSMYLDEGNDSYENKDNISLYSRVNDIKSDIRRLKGMLLNHRNFPKYKANLLKK